MKEATAKVELIANACVIAAVFVFILSLAYAVLRSRHASPVPQSSIVNGRTLPLTHDWFGSTQTLVLVLSADCKYCIASAPFYRRLVEQTSSSRRTKLLAVFPQSPTESQKYMSGLDIKINDIKQMTPSSLGVKGTPTLILVNANGVVIRSWEGLLLPDAQSEVLAAVN